MDQLFIGLISNLPNLAGIIILAYVLNKQYGDLLKLYSELLDKYHALVLVLGENKQITPAQINQLLHPIKEEKNAVDSKTPLR